MSALTPAQTLAVRELTLDLERALRLLRLRLAFTWTAPDPKLATEAAADLRRIAQKLEEVSG